MCYFELFLRKLQFSPFDENGNIFLDVLFFSCAIFFSLVKERVNFGRRVELNYKHINLRASKSLLCTRI